MNKEKNKAAVALGRIKSERKTIAARLNGKLGGRPSIEPEVFETWESAFAKCRELDKPLKIQVPIRGGVVANRHRSEVAKIWPSGRCRHIEYV